jgi:small-conductance mechanosensitive channel
MRCLAALIGLWFLLAAASAQEKDQAAETAANLRGLSGQERSDLIAKLDDTQVRDLLLYYLRTSAEVAASPEQAGNLLGAAQAKAVRVRENAALAAFSIKDLPAALVTAHTKLSAGDGLLGLLVVLVAVAILVAAGLGAEWLYAAAVRRLRDDLRAATHRGSEAWLRSSFGVLLINLLGVGSFVAGYVLAFLVLWQGNEARREFAAVVLVGFVVVRLTQAFAEFLLNPLGRGDRVLPLTAEGAQYFYQGTVRISVVGAVVLSVSYLLGLWSEDPHLRMLLMAIGGGVFVAYAAVVLWKGRQHAAHAFLTTDEGGEAPAWPMRALAYVWAPAVIAYMAAVYLAAIVAALAGTPIGVTRGLAALIVVVVAVPVIDRFVGIAFASRRSGPATDPLAPAGRQSFVLRRALRITIVVAAILIVLTMFGVTAAARQTFGGWLVQLVLNVGVVVLVAYVLQEVTVAAINRRLAMDTTLKPKGDGGFEPLQASRLRTILPLVRRALQVAIVTIAALMILSALGVNIGPLLAGAGIVGLAVGFGAQTLVKDLISGLFFLLDDAFRVGEYIEVGGFGGEVERINTRSLSLRTPLGAVHTIPFGGIDAVANYSRDWAIVKMEFRVTYDTDLGKVKKIFRRIGEELAQDAELAPGFLQPFKFQGVKAMEETGILLRGKFMAVPGAQFQIRKQVFERVQKAFAAEGIKFAQRRVQVDLPPGVEMDEQTKEAISSAAGAALGSEVSGAKN